MRFSRIYDEGGGFAERDPLSTQMEAEAKADNPLAGTPAGAPAPAAPAPTGGGPGPVTSPSPQGGPAPAPRPPVPPAVASAIPGVQGSEETGGVQGSFGQAGTAGFSKRFGMPAAWFKGGPTAGLAREAANTGRGVLAKGSVGGGVGGGGSSEGVVSGPTLGLEAGGGQNDEQWQRVLAAVMKNRFGGGGQ